MVSSSYGARLGGEWSWEQLSLDSLAQWTSGFAESDRVRGGVGQRGMVPPISAPDPDLRGSATRWSSPHIVTSFTAFPSWDNCDFPTGLSLTPITPC